MYHKSNNDMLGIDYHFEDHYYTKDLFDYDKWIEIDEEWFNDCVIKYRQLFDMKWNGNEKIFIDRTIGLEEFKIIRIKVKGSAPWLVI